MTARIVHQFPGSHFCEKTRWHLDHKKLPYGLRNLLPGLHVAINRRIAGKRTVPVLVDGEQIVADSTAIALYLEQRYPERPLLPAQPEERARAVALDAYFNDTFGVEVRRYCYGQTLRVKKRTREFFFRGYQGWARSLGAAFLGPVLERELVKMYEIDEANLQSSERTLEEAMERLERELEASKSEYLVGGSLSLADVCAASLLAPLVGPPNTAWDEFPDDLSSLHAARDKARARRAGQWVLARYAADR